MQSKKMKLGVCCKALMLFLLLFSCKKNPTHFDADDNNSQTITINYSPQITKLSATLSKIKMGESIQVTCMAIDPNNDTLTYEWDAVKVLKDANDDGYHLQWDKNAGQIHNTGNEAVWQSPFHKGFYLIACKVYDSANLEDMAVVEIEVCCNYEITDVETAKRCVLGEKIIRHSMWGKTEFYIEEDDVLTPIQKRRISIEKNGITEFKDTWEIPITMFPDLPPDNRNPIGWFVYLDIMTGEAIKIIQRFSS